MTCIYAQRRVPVCVGRDAQVPPQVRARARPRGRARLDRRRRHLLPRDRERLDARLHGGRAARPRYRRSARVPGYRSSARRPATPSVSHSRRELLGRLRIRLRQRARAAILQRKGRR